MKEQLGSYGLGDGLGVDESAAEFLPVLVVARVLDDNLLKVVRQLEDDVLVLLAELEVVPGGDTLLVDGCSARGLLLVSSLVLAVEPCHCLGPSQAGWVERGRRGVQCEIRGEGGNQPGLRLEKQWISTGCADMSSRLELTIVAVVLFIGFGVDVLSVKCSTDR